MHITLLFQDLDAAFALKFLKYSLAMFETTDVWPMASPVEALLLSGVHVLNPHDEQDTKEALLNSLLSELWPASCDFRSAYRRACAIISGFQPDQGKETLRL